jgi:hypothetical protein
MWKHAEYIYGAYITLHIKIIISRMFSPWPLNLLVTLDSNRLHHSLKVYAKILKQHSLSTAYARHPE